MPRKHASGRPPNGAVDILALDEQGRWVTDDGLPHRAFSFKDGLVPIAMAARCGCKDWDNNNCPMRLAMNKTADRWSCANGRRF